LKPPMRLVMTLNEQLKIPRTDIVDAIRRGSSPHEYIPEQERNFEAGITPTETAYKCRGEVMIEGERWLRYS